MSEASVTWKRSATGHRRRHAFGDAIICVWREKVARWEPADTPRVCDPQTCAVCFAQARR